MRKMNDSILYMDCFSGVAGDMFVGALLDLGVGSRELLERELAKIDVAGWSLSAQKVQVSGMAATQFQVQIEGEAQDPRSFSDIEELVARSDLDEKVRSHCLAIFGRVARAEAKAHGESLNTVHFHEIGMVDSIIDIVSSCVLIEELQPGAIICSPVTLGSGTVQTRHGIMPVPSPATANLLMGLPVRQGPERQELATPTGAALVSYFARRFGSLPAMTLAGIGYGAGTRETQGPNLLRLITGERLGVEGVSAGAAAVDRQVILETNIDDSTPEQLAFLVERLLGAGAQDAWMTPVTMKKGRAAVVLSALCSPETVDALLDLIFTESSTFGVRISGVERHCLMRRIETVETQYGLVRLKIGRWKDQDITFAPEYEDCKAAAEKYGVPIAAVFEAARAALA